MNGASTADDAPPASAAQDPASPSSAEQDANGASGSGSIKKRKKDALKPIITTEE